jgi:hypothetical protein
MATAINKPLNVEKAPIELKPGQRILKSGVIYDENKGRFVGKAHDNPYAFTSENAHEFHRLRREKTAALLRLRIVEVYNAGMPDSAKSSAGAFAGAGAMLFEQIVLNSEAYPRDRMEAWDKLGKAAGVLADPREPGGTDGGMQGASDLITGVNKLVELLRDTIQPSKAQLHDTIDADIASAE